MAEQDQERTELPTQKRREEARRKGQIPRSQDLSTACVVLIAGGGLYYLGGSLGNGLHQLMQGGLSLSRDQALDESLAIGQFASEMMSALMVCAPVLGLTLVAALLAPLSIGGWNLSFSALAPDFSRLSPMTGIKRVFSVRGLVELGKAFAKFGLVGLFAALFLWSKSGELLSLGAQPTAAAIGHAVSLSGQGLLTFAAALGLIAAVDVPFQLWQYTQQLKMSRQEIREEMKESEGSPETRGRIRNLQREVASRRMMQEVPKADVVVTNPTHFSVALRYDERKMRAPVVVAKGADEIAARIREVATENLVPIFEAPPLARALYKHVEIGAPIPASLYVAVAQVLTYIYQLRAARRTGEVPPAPPSIDPSVEDAPGKGPTRH